MAVLGVVVVQMVVLAAIALALGWRPAVDGLGWALLLVLLGCAAFGALGILVGGTLRAEVTLAVANLIWLVLVLVGGIVVPVDEMPRTLAAVAQWLPTAALADGLRTTLATGAAPTGQQVLVLVAWAAVAAAAAVRLVRWRYAGRLASERASARPPAAHLTARHAHAGGRRRGRAGGHRRSTGRSVRVTGSGLGCPTWPRCFPGSLVPVPHPETQALTQWIEFGNRLLTFLVVIVAGACLVAALATRPRRRRLTRLALVKRRAWSRRPSSVG